MAEDIKPKATEKERMRAPARVYFGWFEALRAWTSPKLTAEQAEDAARKYREKNSVTGNSYVVRYDRYCSLVGNAQSELERAVRTLLGRAEFLGRVDGDDLKTLQKKLDALDMSRKEKLGVLPPSKRIGRRRRKKNKGALPKK